MLNSGVKRPHKPLSVLVRDPERPTMWSLGLIVEWRWIDESAGTWEGHVSVGSGAEHWITGIHLTRIPSPVAEHAGLDSQLI